MDIERLEHIDAFKGLAILGVVLIHIPHAGVPPRWVQFASYWAVFSFFFLSGWMMWYADRPADARVHFLARGKRFGKVYLRYTLLFLLLDMVLIGFGWYEKDRIIKDLYKSAVFTGIGTLWFLPVLLMGETLVLGLRGLPKYRNWILPATFIVIAAWISGWIVRGPMRASGIVGEALSYPLLTLGLIGECMLTIFLGFLAGKLWGAGIIEFYRHRHRLVLLFAGAMLIAAGIILMILTGQYTLIIGRLSTILPFSIGFMLLMMGMEKTWISGFFSFWGRNSLLLMCTHYSITLVLIEIGYTLITGGAPHGQMDCYLYMGLCLIFTFIMIRLKERYGRKRKA